MPATNSVSEHSYSSLHQEGNLQCLLLSHLINKGPSTKLMHEPLVERKFLHSTSEQREDPEKLREMTRMQQQTFFQWELQITHQENSLESCDLKRSCLSENQVTVSCSWRSELLEAYMSLYIGVNSHRCDVWGPHFFHEMVPTLWGWGFCGPHNMGMGVLWSPQYGDGGPVVPTIWGWGFCGPHIMGMGVLWSPQYGDGGPVVPTGVLWSPQYGDGGPVVPILRGWGSCGPHNMGMGVLWSPQYGDGGPVVHNMGMGVLWSPKYYDTM